MRFALVAGGMVPVPPPGWGAAENLVWNYAARLERLGHTVDIYNTPWFNDVVVQLRAGGYDFIHLHFDLFCGAFNRHLGLPFCVTSHYGGFGRYAAGGADPSYTVLFEDTLEAPGNLVFSEPIRRLYEANGYAGFLRALGNPVECERFSFNPRGNGRALCLGKVQPRKRQALLARALEGRLRLDVAGPFDPADDPDFRPGETVRYLGSWSREQVYAQIGDYSCLVLLSESEGDALVLKEALAAGLSVVTNEPSRGCLEPEEFVTILPADALEPDLIAAAVTTAIERNSHPGMRQAIRDYARVGFDYAAVLPGYLELVQEFREHSRAAG